jgi:hypothetical protein
MWFTGKNYYKLAVEKDAKFGKTTIRYDPAMRQIYCVALP